MITGFCGLPRSGKSYDAVKKIIENVKRRRQVFTNIDGLDDTGCRAIIADLAGMNVEELDEYLIHFESEKMNEGWKFWNTIPVNSLIVIDEVHFNFNCRDWNTQKNTDFVEFCSVHGKRGIDICLITQSMDKIDKQARSSIEWTYLYKKMNYFGSLIRNSYTRHSYSLDDHSGKPLSTSCHNYDRRIFNAYRSYTHKASKEINFMSHVNVLKHPVFYAIPVIVAFACYMFFYKSSFASGDLFGAKKTISRFDSQKNMLKNYSSLPLSQVKPVPSFKAYSAGSVSKLSSIGNTPFARFPVSGYVQMDKAVHVLVCGQTLKLPSPIVKNYSVGDSYVTADTSILGNPEHCRKASNVPVSSVQTHNGRPETSYSPMFVQYTGLVTVRGKDIKWRELAGDLVLFSK